MKAFVIANDTIINAIEVDDIASVAEMLAPAEVIEADGINAWIGWVRNVDIWQPPADAPTAEPVPAEITDRQFFQAIASPPWNLITQVEALAAVQVGAIPGAMQAFIDALPASQQFEAAMLISGASTFVRDNPLVDAFGAAQGMSAAQIDALWVFAKGL